MTIMPSFKFMILLFLAMAFFGHSMAAHYQVGDAAGWTGAGTVDYAFWAFGHHFRVGDYLDFKYNPQFHNVMEVSKEDFESCNSSSPILTYTTGHDSVELTSGGHHYFICGTPGHCKAAGQKVDIFVLGGNSGGPGDGSPSISPPNDDGDNDSPSISPPNDNSASLMARPNFISLKWLYLIANIFLVHGLL
ncbi:hypothetical protein ABFS83_07G057500 [Erythranthe nasuta]